MLAFFAKTGLFLWLVFVVVFLRWFHVAATADERDVP
jgi:hypothetical protein